MPYLLAAGPETDPIRFQLYRSTARISQGTTNGTGEIVLQASGPEKKLDEAKDVPKVSDSVAPPAVTFGAAESIPGQPPGTRAWRVPVNISNLSGTGTFARTLAASWNGVTTSLPYNISNTPAPPLVLTLGLLPSEWNAAQSPCLRMRISASGALATGIGLTSTLTDTTTKKNVSSQLFLSLDGTTAAPSAALERAVNETGAPLYLCLSRDFAWSGTFTGNINVSAIEKPEGTSAAITVYCRRPWAVWVGVIALGVGCFFALVFRYLLPAYRAFRQALLPAAILYVSIGRALEALKGRPKDAVSIKSMPSVLAESSESLKVDTLIAKNLIPSRWGNPFRTPDAAAYKTLLDTQSARIHTVQILMKEGIQELDKIQPPTAKSRGDIGRVDAIAAQNPFPMPDAARHQVQEIISGAPGEERVASQATPMPRLGDLIVSIDTVTLFTLLGWVVISFVSGYLVLVLGRPGFGSPLDYLQCLLWAFGISVAGAITSNPAGTALNMKPPESL
ncbi:MAG: hypothetical protein HYX27_10065 [Acidobacteria bacterium]|nr:hypothetical protein [Acidobacteriota bacterium]